MQCPKVGRGTPQKKKKREGKKKKRERKLEEKMGQKKTGGSTYPRQTLGACLEREETGGEEEVTPFNWKRIAERKQRHKSSIGGEVKGTKTNGKPFMREKVFWGGLSVTKKKDEERG